VSRSATLTSAPRAPGSRGRAYSVMPSIMRLDARDLTLEAPERSGAARRDFLLERVRVVGDRAERVPHLVRESRGHPARARKARDGIGFGIAVCAHGFSNEGAKTAGRANRPARVPSKCPAENYWQIGSPSTVEPPPSVIVQVFAVDIDVAVAAQPVFVTLPSVTVNAARRPCSSCRGSSCFCAYVLLLSEK